MKIIMVMEMLSERLRKSLLDRMDTNLGVRLEKQQGKFCCLLSHDLDDVKSGKIIDDVVELEDDMGIRSTLFVMPSQTKFRDAIMEARERGFDIALHNIKRPLVTINPPFSVSRLVEKSYIGVLRSEIVYFNRKVGRISGFAPHGIGCYLQSDINTSWDIIENTALSCDDILWVRGYRGILKTDNGHYFGKPVPMYWRIRGEQRKLVIPVSWDDRFLFSSWEERNFYGGKASNSVEDAMHDIYSSLDFCGENNIPFVINLHPIHWVNGVIETMKLLEKLVPYCRMIKCPMYTFTELYKMVAR